MEPTAIGNAVIWHRRAKSEEWLWDWEISFRVDCPPHHFPLPRKHSLRRTCFVRGTSTPHIFKGGSWVRAPVSSLPVSLPSLRQERSLVWEMQWAAGVGQDAVSQPRNFVVAVHFECVLSLLTREIPQDTQGLCREASRVSAALLWLNESPSRGRINRTSTWFYQMQALSHYLGLSLNNWYFEFVWFITKGLRAHMENTKRGCPSLALVWWWFNH